MAPRARIRGSRSPPSHIRRHCGELKSWLLSSACLPLSLQPVRPRYFLSCRCQSPPLLAPVRNLHHTLLSSSSEERIERLVRFPLTLSARERKELESRIASSAYARELATYFERFYFEVDALDSATFEEVPPTVVLKHVTAESARQSMRDWRLVMYVPQVVLGMAAIVATIRGSLGPISAEALTTPILLCFCIYVAAAFLGAAANGTSTQQLRSPAPA